VWTVNRPKPGPTFSSYEEPIVLHTLRTVFSEKCYLCENIVAEPEVEHFIPKTYDSTKVNDWNNLYYACPRCNSIKGHDHTPLLDCCNPIDAVSRSVKCRVPSIPDEDVFVEAQNARAETAATTILLEKCYNSKNTERRGISRQQLHEEIYKYFLVFINCRQTIKDLTAMPSAKSDAQAKLREMTQDFYPFSIFWKWHIAGDPVIAGMFPGVL
jgi:hypothetical protein